MAQALCPQCGTQVPESARYCGQCGYVRAVPPQDAGAAPPPQAAQSAARQANLGKTMLQFAVPEPTPTAPAPAVAPAPAPSPAAAPAPQAPPVSPLLAQTTFDPSMQDRARTMMELQAPVRAPEPVGAADRSNLAKTIFDPTPPFPPSQTEPMAPALGAQTLVDPGAFGGAPNEKKTMLGISAMDMRGMPAAPPQPGAAPAPPPAPAPAPAPAAQGTPLRHGGTMLGVAMPGIAPLHASAPQPQQPGSPQGQQRSGTMLGVATPGIAPLASTAAMPGAPQGAPQPAADVQAPGAKVALKPVTIIGMPAPFVDDEPLPSAPSRRSKKGIPAVVVVGIVTAIVAIGGVVLFFLLHGPPPLAAKPAIDAQGRDVLELRCESCPDGTIVSQGDAKATMQGNAAQLVLPAPLAVGDNNVKLHIDRPGVGRDEDQSLVVPVAYRVRADLSTLAAKPPTITIRVDATPGSDVTLDDKPIALDAQGRAAYPIDVSAETEGPSVETRVLERKVSYSVTPKGGTPEKGTVSARVGVAFLRIDAPLAHAIVQDKTVSVAGQTTPGATVSLDGKPLAVDAKGSFAGTLEVAAVGDKNLLLEATAPQLAPRRVHLTVKRVENLESEAKAFEAASPLGYDAIAGDITSKVGQKTVVEGEVLDSTVISHQTIALVETHRGCAQGHCLTRVVIGGEAQVAKGETIRVYGRVARAFTGGGKTVPEVEADFVLKGRR